MPDARDHTRAALAFLARAEIESDGKQLKELKSLARNSMAAAVEEGAGLYIATLARELEEQIDRHSENTHDPGSAAA